MLKLKIVGTKPKLINRGAKNLRDILVHSFEPKRYKDPFGLPSGFYRCGQCPACINLKLKKVCIKEFKNPRTMEIHQIKEVLTCRTKYVVYVLICPCGKLYVGRTIRTLYV